MQCRVKAAPGIVAIETAEWSIQTYSTVCMLFSLLEFSCDICLPWCVAVRASGAVCPRRIRRWISFVSSACSCANKTPADNNRRQIIFICGRSTTDVGKCTWIMDWAWCGRNAAETGVMCNLASLRCGGARRWHVEMLLAAVYSNSVSLPDSDLRKLLQDQFNPISLQLYSVSIFITVYIAVQQTLWYLKNISVQ